MDTSVFIDHLEDGARYARYTATIFEWLSREGHAAVIAATELAAGATCLVTNDAALARVGGIEVALLDSLAAA